MSKRYYMTNKQFKKLSSTARELFDLLFISNCFADNYLADICEVDCIVPLLKHVLKDADNLLCMVSYLETKDSEMADIFD